MTNLPRWVSGPLASALLISVSLAGLPSPVSAAGREVSCESHGMRHAYCSTGRHGTVKLLSSAGFWPCKEGETWGTETEGIWVDNGCKGRFHVEDPSSGHDHSGAVAAAAVGIGLLAILAASHHKSDEPHGDNGVPNWVIGDYHGYNPRARLEITMHIGAAGRVAARVRDRSMDGSWVPGNEIRWEDGTRSTISRTSEGLRLTQVDDARNVVEYYRD